MPSPCEATGTLSGLPGLYCSSRLALTHRMTGSDRAAPLLQPWRGRRKASIRRAACTLASGISIRVAGAPRHWGPCALVVWGSCQAKCKPPAHPDRSRGGSGVRLSLGRGPGTGESCSATSASQSAGVPKQFPAPARQDGRAADITPHPEASSSPSVDRSPGSIQGALKGGVTTTYRVCVMPQAAPSLPPETQSATVGVTLPAEHPEQKPRHGRARGTDSCCSAELGVQGVRTLESLHQPQGGSQALFLGCSQVKMISGESRGGDDSHHPRLSQGMLHQDPAARGQVKSRLSSQCGPTAKRSDLSLRVVLQKARLSRTLEKPQPLHRWPWHFHGGSFIPQQAFQVPALCQARPVG